MKHLLALAVLVVTASPASAVDCIYLQWVPVQKNGQVQYRFVDTCGRDYEVGYRLEGNTLHFPRGGQHTLPEGSEAEAEKVLRETYGLVGERDRLIRTKW